MADKDDYLEDILIDLGFGSPDKAAQVWRGGRSDWGLALKLLLPNKICHSASSTRARAAGFGSASYFQQVVVKLQFTDKKV